MDAIRVEVPIGYDWPTLSRLIGHAYYSAWPIFDQGPGSDEWVPVKLSITRREFNRIAPDLWLEIYSDYPMLQLRFSTATELERERTQHQEAEERARQEQARRERQEAEERAKQAALEKERAGRPGYIEF
jgi:hypothetical protein